jgi:hypothetical protein
MALDPLGNKGVSRAPMPSDGIDCRLCRDTCLIYWEGEYRMAPHTEGKRRELQLQATEANETLRNLERKTKR